MHEQELTEALQEAQVEIDRLTDVITAMQDDISRSTVAAESFFSNPYLKLVAHDWITKIIEPLHAAKKRFAEMMDIPF